MSAGRRVEVSFWLLSTPFSKLSLCFLLLFLLIPFFGYYHIVSYYSFSFQNKYPNQSSPKSYFVSMLLMTKFHLKKLSVFGFVTDVFSWCLFFSSLDSEWSSKTGNKWILWWILLLFESVDEILNASLWHRTAGYMFKRVNFIENKYMRGVRQRCCCGLTDPERVSHTTVFPEALKQEKNTNKLYILL